MDLSNFGRFSDPSVLILTSLASGPKHGYAIMQDIRQFYGSRLEPGTLYGALARLEQRGWIRALPAEDRRRPYQITQAGELVLRTTLTHIQHMAQVGLHRLGGAEI